jgi:DNA-binding transcriptional MocR family regulator
MTIWAPDLARHSGPRYIAIADALAADVKRGRLKPGDRLPTHRDLAYRLGVTVGTITRAYTEAEGRGLVRGEVGRGTYVLALPPTVTTFGPRDPVHESRSPIDLSINVAWPGDSDAPLAQALAQLSQRSDLTSLLSYQPHRGLPAHRAAGAEWIARTRGYTVSPEQVLVTCGGQHGMAIALGALARPGDLVLCEALTYPGMRIIANFLHLRLQGVAMDEHGMIPEALDAACRAGAPKAIYCMPVLQNPTGILMPEERRRAIAEVAEAHGVAIIEDDVYGFLAPDGPPPLASYAPRLGHYVTSASKSMAPGLRTGFLAVPPGTESGFALALRSLTWMATPLTAEVVAIWIADGTADRLAASRRAEATARQKIAKQALAGFDYRAADTAFHGWLTLPARWRSEAFVTAARERGVLITPAEAFSLGNTAPQAVRLCLGGARDHEPLSRGLAVLRELLSKSPPSADAAEWFAMVV